MNGIDVSSNNHSVKDFNWPSVKDAGYDFVYVKTTEGTTYLNPYAADDIAGARAAGLLVGVYHYYKPGIPASAQADWFISKGVVYDLMPVVDIEENPVGTTERDQFVTTVGECAQYVNRTFFQALGLGKAAWTWLAWPGYHNEPLDPSVRIIQNSATGSVPGIPGNVDLNITIGNLPITIEPSPLPPETEDMDNETYVAFLFRFLLYRAPDNAGFLTWVDQLNKGTSRVDVWGAIQNSPEGVDCLNKQRKVLGLPEVTAP